VLELAVFKILINNLEKMLNSEVREFGNRKLFNTAKMRAYCQIAVDRPLFIWTLLLAA